MPNAMFEPKVVMPVLRVRDMNASLTFYTQLLGFHAVWQAANDGGGENCLLSWGSVELMLSTGPHLGAPPAMTGAIYFNGTGVAALYERINAAARIVWPLAEMEYGTREFGIHDPDGYTLAFAEDLSQGAETTGSST